MIRNLDLSVTDYKAVFTLNKFYADSSKNFDDDGELICIYKTKAEAVEDALVECGSEPCIWLEDTDNHAKSEYFTDWAGDEAYLTIEMILVKKDYETHG